MMMAMDVPYREYQSRLIAELTRVLGHRIPDDPLERSWFLDDFKFERVYFQGDYPDARLVMLFRQPEQSDCLYGAKSLNVWTHQATGDDLWPLDVTEERYTIDDVVHTIRIRIDLELWPAGFQQAPPCNPDEAGVTWVNWHIGGF